MNQLLNSITILINFPEIQKSFRIMIQSDVTVLQLKEELSQQFNPDHHDIEFYYEDKLLDLDQPLTQQGVKENGVVKVQYAIPVTITIDSKNQKQVMKLTSSTRTIDLQAQILSTQNIENVMISFYKNKELVKFDKTLFEQGIRKYDILQAKFNQAGG